VPAVSEGERPMPYGRAITDVVQGLSSWRIWYSLGMNDIQQRYRRSKIGQFWLTISMALTIVGIGLVYSTLFNVDARAYVPYLGVSLIVWNFVSVLVNDSATAFISSETYLRNYPGPRSIVIHRMIVRNFIFFAHNIVLIPPILLYGRVSVSFATALSVVGIIFIIVNAIWLGLLLGTLCARFRDLQQIVLNVVALAFFVTPIVFKPSQIGDRFWALTHLNPFATLLELVRAPLLNEVPELHHYIFACIFTCLGFAVSIPFYNRFAKRIVYWL
jgi:ABC-type polysaccharide/polyol phosphate export permease